MRRAFVLTLVPLVLCTAGLSGTASAETTSVKGTEAFTKLVLDNQQDQVVIKMFAPGGKNKVRWLNAIVRDKDGTRYALHAGWYGEEWQVSLSDPVSDELVPCKALALGYNSDRGFWKGVIPRGCLDDLANRIKVNDAQVVDDSPTPGTAGPTPYVARG